MNAKDRQQDAENKAMSAPDPAPESDAGESTVEAKTRKGGGIAWLALFLALTAVGVAAWVFTLQDRDEPGGAQTNRHVTELENAIAQVESELQSARDDIAAVLERRNDSENEMSRMNTRFTSIEATLQSQAQTIAQLRAQTERLARRTEAINPGQGLRELKLVELEILLRHANRLLTLHGDVDAAIQTLQSADSLLADLSASNYQSVRRAVREEIASLQALEPIDTAGLHARFAALISRVPDLPLKDGLSNRQFETPVSEDNNTETGWWDMTTDFLGRYFTVRRTDQSGTELPSPESLHLIHEQLQLKLEQARLALLRGAPAIYRRSLEEAAQWTRRYFDLEAEAVSALLREIEMLQGTAIQPDLPQTGAALDALHAVRAESG